MGAIVSHMLILRRIRTLVAALVSFVAGAMNAQARPAFDLATLPADLVIGRIAGAVQLTGGAVVVADDIEDKLHLFDASGRYVASAGRTGKGPGEFTGMRWVGECGVDSVFVHDQTQGRVSVFSSVGKYVRSFAPSNGNVVLMSCAPDGTTAFAVPSANKVQGLHGSVVIAFGRDTTRTDGVLLDEGMPVGASLRMAVGSRRVYFGAGRAGQIAIVDPQRAASIPLSDAARIPTQKHRDASIDEIATRIHGTERDYERLRRMLRTMPSAERLPIYTDLFHDHVTGLLWILMSSPGDVNTLLRAVDARGSTIREARLPPGVRVFQVRNNMALLKISDGRTDEESLMFVPLLR